MYTRNDKTKRDISCRAYHVRTDTFNKESRSVEAVIATEERVEIYDMNRWEVIEEVLLMAGCIIPDSRQIPYLNSHVRFDLEKQLGSTRELRIEGDKLVGRNVCAKTPEGDRVLALLEGGHVTDNSIGYRVINSVTIEPGKTDNVSGRNFAASPTRALRVTTEWAVKENSACAVAADPAAKNRNEDFNLENNKMDFNTWLKKRGFNPENLDEAQRTSLQEMFNKETGVTTAGDTAAAEKKRCSDIRLAAKAANASEDLIQRCIDDDLDIDQARAAFLKDLQSSKAANIGEASIRVGAEPADHLFDAASDAILMRAGVSLYKEDHTGKVAIADDGQAVKREAHGQALQFMNLRCADLARHCLEMSGVTGTREMSDRKAVQEALSERASISTISLPNILSNSMSRSLRAAYQEYAPAWPKFCRRETHKNFKEISRLDLSKIAGLEQVGEGGGYAYGTVGESKETYMLAKFGKIIGLSWESIVNDDLKSFARIPIELAMAARRKEDTLAFIVLTANANMADGKALFHADHGNLGSGVINVVNLNAAKVKFRKQKALAEGDENVYINMEPKVLIVPVAIEGEGEMLLASEYDPADNNAKKANIWRNKLDLTPHPILDETSAVEWYLSAAAAHGGIEMCFLTGQEAPHVEHERNFEIDALYFKVRHVAASKAIDHRALYKSSGA